MTASEHRFGQVWYRVLFDVVIVIGVDLQICRAGVLFFFLLRRLFFISLFLQISWLRAQLFFEEHPLSFKSRRQIITADSCTFSSVASGVSFWNSDPSKYRSWFSGAVHVESNRRRFLQGPTPPDDHPAANMLRSPSAPPPSSALLHLNIRVGLRKHNSRPLGWHLRVMKSSPPFAEHQNSSPT